MNRLPCSPCLIVFLHEITDDPDVAYNSIIVVYPTNIIDIFEGGPDLTHSYEYDTKVPA
jgi:hypothetical protein